MSRLDTLLCLSLLAAQPVAAGPFGISSSDPAPSAEVPAGGLLTGMEFGPTQVTWRFRATPGVARTGHPDFDPYLDTSPFENRGIPEDPMAAGGVCYGMSLEALRHFHFATRPVLAQGATAPRDEPIRLRRWLETRSDAAEAAYWQRVGDAQSDQAAPGQRRASEAEKAEARATFGPQGQELLDSWFGYGYRFDAVGELRDLLERDLADPERGLVVLGYGFVLGSGDFAAHAVLVYEGVEGTAFYDGQRYPAKAYRFYDSNLPLESPEDVAAQRAQNQLLVIETDGGPVASFVGGYLDRLGGFGNPWWPQATETKAPWISNEQTFDGAVLAPNQLSYAPVYERYFQRWVDEYRREQGRLPRRGFSD